MKIKTCNNEELKLLLLDRDEVLQSAMSEADLDDASLQKIKRYKKLDEWQQDILYLSAILPVQKVADLYAVSKTHIYNVLKKINKTL